MPEMKFEHGVPSWVDIGTPDVPAGVKFYSDLFGWTNQDLGEEAGHYNMLFKDGKMVAAMSGATDPGPPRWTTYINVDDVDAVTAKVKGAGGQIVMEPMDVMTAGRMAVYADTTGAIIAAWQAGDHKGAELVNEAGTITWNELATSDVAKSKAFYGDVFGWTFGGSDEYVEPQVGGRTIGGIMPRPDTIPAEVPDHWLVYFGVDDVDQGVKHAESLGATLAAGPIDIPDTGRFAVFIDPQGAAFALFQG